jgi:hypothetical protein
METQTITRVRRTLELIVFFMIIAAIMGTFFSANFIRKIKNTSRAVKVYYLMDYRMLNRDFLSEEKNGRVWEI